jgi:hypothetical protein
MFEGQTSSGQIEAKINDEIARSLEDTCTDSTRTAA